MRSLCGYAEESRINPEETGFLVFSEKGNIPSIKNSVNFER